MLWMVLHKEKLEEMQEEVQVEEIIQLEAFHGASSMDMTMVGLHEEPEEAPLLHHPFS